MVFVPITHDYNFSLSLCFLKLGAQPSDGCLITIKFPWRRPVCWVIWAQIGNQYVHLVY